MKKQNEGVQTQFNSISKPNEKRMYGPHFEFSKKCLHILLTSYALLFFWCIQSSPMFYVLHLMSYVLHHSSNILHPASYLLCNYDAFCAVLEWGSPYIISPKTFVPYQPEHKVKIMCISPHRHFWVKSFWDNVSNATM